MSKASLPRASESQLGELHALAVGYYRMKLNSGEMTAADMNGLIRFLKDNGIDCVPGQNTEVQSLIDDLPDYANLGGDGSTHLHQ